MILTTPNQNEIYIFSLHQLKGDRLQNNNDGKIIRLSYHGITFRFWLFMESIFTQQSIKFIEGVIATELSRFIFTRVYSRVSVFIYDSSHKTRFGIIILLTVELLHAEGARAEPHALENLIIHRSEKICFIKWLSVRPYVKN